VRWATPLPQFVLDGPFDLAGFRSYLARAEELGFESAWALEGVLGPAAMLSPLETMAYAAASTSQLRIGCAVFVTPLHQPVHLAKALASLDQLSHGRVEIGVGTGGRVRPFAAFGVEPDSYVRRFNEALQVMKALWAESTVDFEGRFWQLERAELTPKPFQRPHPPLWLGGSAPSAVRRAVREGDGFFGAGSTTTAAFSEQVSIVREQLEQQGRSEDGFRIAKRVYTAVDDDTERARRRMLEMFSRIYGDLGPRLEPVLVVGPPEACIEGLCEVAEAGAEMILLDTLFDEREQMERLASEVMPHVRSGSSRGA
jgi:probable F420-dependent oxidoreductase